MSARPPMWLRLAALWCLCAVAACEQASGEPDQPDPRLSADGDAEFAPGNCRDATPVAGTPHLDEVFDAEFYRRIHADVRSLSTAQAFEHWRSFGVAKGRLGSPTFSPSLYLSRYPDVAATASDCRHAAAIAHYLTTGRDEGRSAVPPNPYAARFLTEVGGSNLVLLRQQEYASPIPEPEATHCRNTFGEDLRSVIGVYHDPAARARIDAKLAALRAAGQRKIGLVLWHRDNNYADSYGAAPGSPWCVVLEAPGVLQDRDQDNVRALVAEIKRLGFDQIDFRFAPSAQSNPAAWPQWDEAQYQFNWNLIVNTRRLIYESLAEVPGPDPRVLFDLAVETGGLWLATWLPYVQNFPLQLDYVRRLWGDYAQTFGVTDTIGFSIVPVEGFIRATIADVYDRAGLGRPIAYGFDVYGDMAAVGGGDTSSIDAQLAAVKSELDAVGDAGTEVFLQETYASSWDNRLALQRAVQDSGLPVRYVFQWPIRFGTDSSYNVEDTSPHQAYEPQVADCDQELTGRHDSVGPRSGDTRLLCFGGRWYGCGGELDQPSWETAATTGEKIGSWTCDAELPGWVRQAR